MTNDKKRSTAQWVSRVLNEKIEEGRPKYAMFRVTDYTNYESQGAQSTEVIFCSVVIGNTMKYGYSVRSPNKDAFWKNYGKAVAKERLKTSLKEQDLFSEFPVGPETDPIGLCWKIKEHFRHRIITDDLENKFPEYIRQILLAEKWELIQPNPDK